MYHSITLVITCILLQNGVVPLCTGKSCEDYSCPSPTAMKRSIDEMDATICVNTTQTSRKADNFEVNKGFEDSECPSFETSERKFKTLLSSFWVPEDNMKTCKRFECEDLFEVEERTFDGISVPKISFPYQAYEFSSAAIDNDGEDVEGSESFSHTTRKRATEAPTNVEDLPQSKQGATLFTIVFLQFLFGINYDSANIIATTSFAKYGAGFYKHSDIQQVEKFASVCEHFGLNRALSLRIGTELQLRYYNILFQTAFEYPCVRITEGQAAIAGFLTLQLNLPTSLAFRIALAITNDYGYNYLSLTFPQQRRVIESVCESFGKKCKKQNRQVADELLLYFRDELTPLIASNTPVLVSVAADPDIKLTIRQLSIVQLLKFNFNIDFKVAIKIVLKMATLCESDFSRLPYMQKIQTFAAICRDEFGLDFKLSIVVATTVVVNFDGDMKL